MTTTVENTETTTEKPVKKPRKPRVAKQPKKVEESTVTASVPQVSAGERFLFALGRRKTAIARVRVWVNGEGNIEVNGKPADEYFHTYEERLILRAPLKITGNEMMNVKVVASGGGAHSQAEAVRLALSRVLIQLNPTYRKTLKKLGYLTRDPRAKERKKFGLKRARRAPQWSKR